MGIILKCNMCGGELDVQENESVAICQYCGTRQILSQENRIAAEREGERNRKIRIFLFFVVMFFILLIAIASTIPNIDINPKNAIKSLKVGEVVYFGDYYWQVLDKKDGKVLLVTEDCIALMPYNDKYEYSTWKSCTLRKWLNNDFLNSFSNDQQAKIAITEVVTNYSATFHSNKTENTVDKVFLLSTDEALEYFPDDKSRVVKHNMWWLRSLGYTDKHIEKEINDFIVIYGQDIFRAKRVDSSGNISEDSIDDNGGVRPALWLNQIPNIREVMG